MQVFLIDLDPNADSAHKRAVSYTHLVPSNEAIADALTHTGYQRLICSSDGIDIPDGMALDLGGVAKG